MTRIKVFQIGLAVFIFGGVVYELFQFFGLESISAGIAAQSILILIICLWTASYLFRVFTGNMTFMEQRKRYRKAYEEITEEKMKEKFDALSPEEKKALIEEVEKETNETI